MPRPAKRRQSRGDHRGLIDGCHVRLIEPSLQPPCTGTMASPAIPQSDQRGQLERIDEAEAAELPRSDLRHHEIAALECVFQDPPRVLLVAQAVPPRLGPGGGRSLAPALAVLLSSVAAVLFEGALELATLALLGSLAAFLLVGIRHPAECFTRARIRG